VSPRIPFIKENYHANVTDPPKVFDLTKTMKNKILDPTKQTEKKWGKKLLDRKKNS